MATLLHASKKDGTFEKQRKQAKATFLETFADGYSINFAAKAAGVERPTPYGWAEQDPQFAEDWEQAKEARGDWYEDRLRDQADKGIPVSTIVGLKMHKRFIEDRGGNNINVQGDLNVISVTNQVALLIAEADARFPGLAEFWAERVKALGDGKAK